MVIGYLPKQQSELKNTSAEALYFFLSLQTHLVTLPKRQNQSHDVFCLGTMNENDSHDWWSEGRGGGQNKQSLSTDTSLEVERKDRHIHFSSSRIPSAHGRSVCE